MRPVPEYEIGEEEAKKKGADFYQEWQVYNQIKLVNSQIKKSLEEMLEK